MKANTGAFLLVGLVLFSAVAFRMSTSIANSYPDLPRYMGSVNLAVGNAAQVGHTNTLAFTSAGGDTLRIRELWLTFVGPSTSSHNYNIRFYPKSVIGASDPDSTALTFANAVTGPGAVPLYFDLGNGASKVVIRNKGTVENLVNYVAIVGGN